ncbi:hypothetical protein [Actinokineospora spheciospongiae]|uniref:hypothetical protein n=1 Tax=Actinokineospora spheciospongiae TaxID=909613 RepID=UPI000D71C9DA|nr:hypothetical protein [Actinokineospora spheciospongiae]PWW62047.1 hypothetical protein DFQ13_106299 [Actinokineospora spheciospongiae]
MNQSNTRLAHAFVDESRRSATYLLAAAVIPAGSVRPIRTLMRSLRMPGARRIHFKHERDAVRKDIAAAVVEAPVRARVYTGRGKADEVRQAALAALVCDLEPDNLARLVLDSRGEAGDRADRQLIRATMSGPDAFSYEHLRSHEEPALWVPDVVAWCWGAGGNWRRRVEAIVDQVRDVG